MELPNLETLESKVRGILEKYNQLKVENRELKSKCDAFQAEMDELKRDNEQLHTELDDARRNSRDFEKEERIRAKVDELLAQLEEI